MTFPRTLPRVLPRQLGILRPTYPARRAYATIRNDIPLPPSITLIDRKPRIPKARRRIPEDPQRHIDPTAPRPTSRFPFYLGLAICLYSFSQFAYVYYDYDQAKKSPREVRSMGQSDRNGGSSVHHMDAPVPSQHLPSVVVVEKESKGEGNGAADQVPSGTTSVPPFPRTLKLEDGVYHLLGLGIRTVSFLNIQVYVGGLYVHEDDLAGLQMAVLKRVVGQQATAATITEREDMKKMLLDGGEKGERVWRELLLDLEHTKWRSAWRIVPTRNTDFQHLRDGFVRGIQARTKTAPHSPASTDITSSSPDVLALTFNDTSFTESLSSFRSIVGIKLSVPKKKTVILHRSAEGALSVLYDPSGRNDGVLSEETLKMGTVPDPRVSALLWLNYLAGEKVASKEARESVVNGVVGMVERPAGVQLGV